MTSRLDKAMQAFFRCVAAGEKKPGFPRVKPRHQFFTLCYPAMYLDRIEGVIYPKKLAVSQKTCHAPKRLQRIRFLAYYGVASEGTFFHSLLLFFIRSRGSFAKIYGKCAKKCLKKVAFLAILGILPRELKALLNLSIPLVTGLAICYTD